MDTQLQSTDQRKKPFFLHKDPPIDTRNSEQLSHDLRAAIQGEVRFNDGDRAMYSTDASNYRQIPIGVVIPRTTEDVIETVRICRKYGAPIVSRGGGTSLSGQTCNTAVVIDFSKYLNQIIEIDASNRIARVQPGVVLDELRKQAKEHGLTFGPDPATHTHCTIGGMIGNNSCGVHSQMAGRTQFNIEELDILTYEGERLTVGRTTESDLDQIIQSKGAKGMIYGKLKALREKYREDIKNCIPKLPRKVSGFPLEELLPENEFHIARALIGTENTCVTVLEAVVRLVPDPAFRSLVVLGYPDVYSAGNHVPEVLKHNPIGLEGLDIRLTEYMHKKGFQGDKIEYLPHGEGWLVVEMGADSKESLDLKSQALINELRQSAIPPDIRYYTDREHQEAIWAIRESGLGSTAKVPGERDTWPGWEDSAVPPEKVGSYLHELRKLLDKYNYGCSLYGHFGQGCIHTRIDFDLITQEGLQNYRSFVDEAADLVVGYGGSLSGEHGDGQARGELLNKMYGPRLLQAFREFKRIWDPLGKMNPGKSINAEPILKNLRIDTNYSPLPVETTFRFPEDNFSFARAVNRCVGVGKCRRGDGGTMCPSYMVTHEEKHSTRGRARLLFEMLQGDPLKKKWKEEPIHDALDLCLSCKGCKSDCPVNVDMATYKAEFYSHYYKRRMRPMPAYTMGLIYWWARLASKIPSLVNSIVNAPVFSSFLKKIGGIATEREIPPFANQTFKDWFLSHPSKNRGKQKVILWPDTFNNYFHPESAKAAVHVLEEVGFDVRVPQISLCCGRPLYDFGFLDQAKRQLEQVLYILSPALRAGVPVVGLEPSCISVFKDELMNLMPNNADARRLKEQSYLIGDFLEKYASDFSWPTINKKVLVHGHCHQKSILNMDSDLSLLKKLGLDIDMPDSGCCGMAGAFGFEEQKYSISVKCGERVLLPAVREVNKEDFIITNGFSCREQIHQLGHRGSTHIADILSYALSKVSKLEENKESHMKM